MPETTVSIAEEAATINSAAVSADVAVDGDGKGKRSLTVETDETTTTTNSDTKEGFGMISSSSASSLPSVARRPATRNASSKYDFVKVKVWLGDNADHYYVLSRFLLSRMLTVTKLMERRGYGEEYINRYKMMTRFHHQRVPLVILVCGTACAGKSTIATQLAQRLNLPNVLQTDMVYELLRTSTDAPLASTPVWARDFNSSEELITEFCRECRIVRKGLAGDLKKAMKDGKPIIIEGIHLDPSIYLMDEENRERADTHNKNVEAESSAAVDISNCSTQDEQNVENSSESETPHSEGTVEENKSLSQEVEVVEKNVTSLTLEDAKGPEETGPSGNVSENQDLKSKNFVKKTNSAAESIIVPIVLKMAEFDHKALLEEWISTRTFGDKCLAQDQDKLISNLKTIQDYLCSFESQGLSVVNISATTFPQTLDWLHSYLLQCIERGVSSASPRIGSTTQHE